MSTFDNIKNLARLHGLNLQQLAKKAGLSVNAIYRYNQGVEPKLPTLQKIADALGVPVSDINPKISGENIRPEVKALSRQINELDEEKFNFIKQIIDNLDKEDDH